MITISPYYETQLYPIYELQLNPFKWFSKDKKVTPDDIIQSLKQLEKTLKDLGYKSPKVKDVIHLKHKLEKTGKKLHESSNDTTWEEKWVEDRNKFYRWIGDNIGSFFSWLWDNFGPHVFIRDLIKLLKLIFDGIKELALDTGGGMLKVILFVIALYGVYNVGRKMITHKRLPIQLPPKLAKAFDELNSLRKKDVSSSLKFMR